MAELPKREQVHPTFDTLYTLAKKLEAGQLARTRQYAPSSDAYREKLRCYPAPVGRVAALEEEGVASAALDDTLIGIENLNSGYLTHNILDPQVLTKYLDIIEDDLEDTAPKYEPVFTSVYQYYGNSLASFTNTIDDLLLQLSILIKLKVQVPMSLSSIETVPVPLDADTYIGDSESTLK